MKEEFIHADAILDLQNRLDSAIKSKKLDAAQRAILEPYCLTLIHPKVTDSKKREIIGAIQSRIKKGTFDEALVNSLLKPKVSTSVLQIRLRGAGIKMTLGHRLHQI